MIEDLTNSLAKGYLSQSFDAKDNFLPEILTNDSKQGVKVLSSLTSALSDCEEFIFSTAFLTTSGVASLFNTLELIKEKGVAGKILTSKYLQFTQPEALRRIIENFPNIELKILETGNLHAKSYVFRKGDLYQIIIGSS